MTATTKHQEIMEKSNDASANSKPKRGHKGNRLARLDLVPLKPLWLLSEVYGRGANKYGERDWEDGVPFSKHYRAMMSHAMKFWGGESIDPDDGQHHLASVAWMAFALMEMEETHPELDDRGRKVQLKSEITDADLPQDKNEK